ncbi:MAG: ABC transporter ATP-binding protein [Streptococcaceae bacterium]|jgi:iron complex transport system ATP-binding protein|nr:ABC transporter ATP-binding protein [Streptococcaceae bacterium]
MYFGAKNINVSFGKQQALKSISLEILRGRTTAIIGRNGSGKSTFLRSLARLIKFEGEVIFENQTLANLTNLEIAKKIAFLPQQSTAPLDLTVTDLVSMGRFPHQKLMQRNLSNSDYEVVRSVMEELELWEFRDRKVASLSGGLQQRAWIGMVLAQDSEIILLDEPTTYLDLSMQLEILKLLKQQAEKYGKTVVYVLHDLNLVARFADEIIVLKDGQLFAEGNITKTFTEKLLYEAFGLEAKLGKDVFNEVPMILGIRL